MKTWHIKELSDLTNVSVRMLRHYDKIGLLAPSFREENGYRCYTAPDLAKLQQIIALKYFGFSLSRIKSILQKHSNVYAHLQAQQQVIKKQNLHLQQVNDVIDGILKGYSTDNSPDWSDLLLLIERYNMTQNLREKLKDSWAGKTLTAEQFEDYLFLYEQFPKEFAMRDSIIEEINQQKVGDPNGSDGERISAFIFDVAKKLKQFFTQQVKLSSSVIEGIKTGQITQLDITPEGTRWLRQATIYYWLKQWNAIYDKIVAHVETPPEGEIGKVLAKEWRDLTDDYFSVGSRDFLIGLILWQDLARQEHEARELKSTPSIQDMLKECHCQLLFNPKASVWISNALDFHSK